MNSSNSSISTKQVLALVAGLLKMLLKRKNHISFVVHVNDRLHSIVSLPVIDNIGAGLPGINIGSHPNVTLRLPRAIDSHLVIFKNLTTGGYDLVSTVDEGIDDCVHVNGRSFCTQTKLNSGDLIQLPYYHTSIEVYF